MESRPRRLLAVALAVAVAFTFAACGSGSGGSDGSAKDVAEALTASPSVTAVPSADARVITVTITADSVTPAGTKVEVKRNQPIVLQIDAATEGEIHVHSTPEKEISFPAGTSQVTMTIDQPGVVDVEDHGLDKLIVQLEVN